MSDEQLYPCPGEWELLRELASRIDKGESIVVDDELRNYLARVGGQVAVSDAEIRDAFLEAEELELVKQIRTRIRDGSRRLMVAMSNSLKAEEEGRLEDARESLESILRTEVVPWYREQARRRLVHLEDGVS